MGAESGRLAGAIRQWVHIVDRRPWAIVLAGACVAVASIFLTFQLRIVTDLKVLIPPDYPSISHLDQLKGRLGTQTDLLVSIEGPSPDANRAFGKVLADRIRALPDIRWVVFHRDPVFFEDNALLFLRVDELLDLRERVIERIREEVRGELIADLSADEPSGEEEEDLSESAIRERYGIDDDNEAYFETDEGRVVVLKARPSSGTTDLTFVRRLCADVEAVIAELDPQSVYPGLSATLKGDYPKRVRTVKTMVNDVINGSLAALAVLLLSLFVYFRRLRAIPLVLTPLLLSAFAALGFASLVYGFLNIVSAFIFAVLLGLGIDFGVHVYGRYEDERHRDRDRVEALCLSLSSTGVSTAAGGMSTAGAFAVLAVADFQGFAQFGIVAAVGIILALIAVFTVLPAMVVLFERRRPWRPTGRARPASESLGIRSRRTIVVCLAIVLVGVGGAGYSAWRSTDLAFEYDFKKLGPKRDKPAETAKKEKSGDGRKWTAALGKLRTLAPAVALTNGLEQTGAIHRRLDALLELDVETAARFGEIREAFARGEAVVGPPPRESDPPIDEEDDPFGDPEEDDPFGEPGAGGDTGGGDAAFSQLWESVAEVDGVRRETMRALEHYPSDEVGFMRKRMGTVFSIFTFVPDRQDEKLVIVRDIRERIERKRGSFSAQTEEELEPWLDYLAVDQTFGAADLPAWVKDQFRDDQGELGRFVVIRNRGSKQNYVTAKALYDSFLFLESGDGQVPVAANYFVLPEIIDTIAREGPLVICLALGVMLLTAFLLFRNVWGVAVIGATVGMAVLWLVGCMVGLGWKATFFNIIAIPLLLGMGQDDALHIYHRTVEEGPGRLRRVLRETGGAVALTTWTTCVGFSAILFANHQGLLGLAKIAVLGMVLCFVSSVVVLPAVLALVERIREKPAP